MVKKKHEHADPIEESTAQNSSQEQVEEPTNTSTIEEQESEKQAEESAENSEQTQENKEQNTQKELEEMQEKHLRLHAEFDNFRRRTLKEKAELIKTGGEKTLIEILPIIDDFERAIEVIQSAQDIEAVKEGVELIYSKFQGFLKKQGIQEIEAKHADFDTDRHEAITKFPAPSDELKGKVVDVLKKGYVLHDKVIRFAQVVVGE